MMSITIGIKNPPGAFLTHIAAGRRAFTILSWKTEMIIVIAIRIAITIMVTEMEE